MGIKENDFVSQISEMPQDCWAIFRQESAGKKLLENKQTNKQSKTQTNTKHKTKTENTKLPFAVSGTQHILGLAHDIGGEYIVEQKECEF